MRIIRALWPVLFIVPLSWWTGRGCAFAGVDPLYHTTVWVHERLVWFVGLLAFASLLTVLTKIVGARARFLKLLELAERPPANVERAFVKAADELSVRIPKIAYLDVDAPIAATVAGPAILLSRGFTQTLDDADLLLVARHELVHASRHHATIGVLWHLLFAALLLPGFEPLERHLHAKRERIANEVAASTREHAYLALVSRASQGSSLCAEPRFGLDASARRVGDSWQMWLAPISTVMLAGALTLSHTMFMHDRPFLLAHHC